MFSPLILSKCKGSSKQRVQKLQGLQVPRPLRGLGW